MADGILTVVSGPAGSGKGTVLAHVLDSDSDFLYSVSATTRPIRPGELDGVNYFFISRQDFAARIKSGGMLEYTEYVGNYYGTPRDFVEKSLAKGKNVLLEIEVDGAFQIKRLFPSAVLIFLCPPNIAVLEERLKGRNTETPQVIRRRLEKAVSEIKRAPDYDYIVTNEEGKASEAAKDILAITRAEKLRSARRAGEMEERFFGIKK